MDRHLGLILYVLLIAMAAALLHKSRLQTWIKYGSFLLFFIVVVVLLQRLSVSHAGSVNQAPTGLQPDVYARVRNQTAFLILNHKPMSVPILRDGVVVLPSLFPRDQSVTLYTYAGDRVLTCTLGSIEQAPDGHLCAKVAEGHYGLTYEASKLKPQVGDTLYIVRRSIVDGELARTLLEISPVTLSGVFEERSTIYPIGSPYDLGAPIVDGFGALVGIVDTVYLNKVGDRGTISGSLHEVRE